MGVVSVPQASDGVTGVNAASVNNPVNTLAAEFNGNIDNTNIKAGAAIDGAKLAATSIPNAQLAANTAWATFAPAGTGFASKTLDTGRWQQIGKVVFCSFHIDGTSNTTAFGFTLPVAAKAADSVTGGIRVANNGAYLAAPGYIATAAGSTTATVFSTTNSGLWTAASTKAAEGYFFYEAA